MAIRIRLRRAGHRNNPFYRIVAADARASTRGSIKENLGWYDPQQEGVNFKLNLERFDYWEGSGAQVSSTVKNLAKLARGLPQAEPVAPAADAATASPEPGTAGPVVESATPASETADSAAPAPESPTAP